MPKYIIEREVPGAANLSQEELRAIAQTSNNVLKEMGEPYHWVQSFVAGDKIYAEPYQNLYKENNDENKSFPSHWGGGFGCPLAGDGGSGPGQIA